MVTFFKYLERVLTAVDDNCPSVVGNIWKAKKRWGRLEWILGREGANPRVSGLFFKAVVKAVLLFGLETWVLTPHMGRALGNFQHGVAIPTTGRQSKSQEEGGWGYPPLDTVIEEERFE